MPSFNVKVEQLKRSFSKPLPGQEAQFLMAPEGRRQMPNYRPGVPAKESSVLLLLFPGEKGLTAPLILRPEYEGAHSAQIGLPGGKKEEGDADLYSTALREASEEIGIDTSNVELLGPLSPLYIPVSNFSVQPYVAACHVMPEFKIDPKEVSQLVELEIETLDACCCLDLIELNLKDGRKIKTPYYSIGGFTVWGATAMILSEFAVILNQLKTKNH